MKQKDLHSKQQDELRKQDVSSQRTERKTEDLRTAGRNNPDRRDVAGEDRIREKLKGRP